MKQLIFLIIILFTFHSFAQDSKQADEYIKWIDNSDYTDTIFLSDTTNGNKTNLTAFEIDGVIVKAIFEYPNQKRIQELYFKERINSSNNICYFNEYYSDHKSEYIQIKSWNNKIIRSDFNGAVNKKYRKNPQDLLREVDCLSKLKSVKYYSGIQKHGFTGKLTELVTLPAYCGMFAWASAFKFEIIETDYKTENKDFILIFTCPRERGDSFFEIDANYTGIMILDNSKERESWTLMNLYEEENLPTFWVREIEKIGK